MWSIVTATFSGRVQGSASWNKTRMHLANKRHNLFDPALSPPMGLTIYAIPGDTPPGVSLYRIGHPTAKEPSPDVHLTTLYISKSYYFMNVPLLERLKEKPDGLW